MTDQDALHAACLANPDDDTPRLAYADWLDENLEVTCPECKGKGGVHLRTAGIPANLCPTDVCPTCDDSGTVIDPSRAAHAELIRVQCEFERCNWCYWPAASVRCGKWSQSSCAPCKRYHVLEARETELLETHQGGWGTLPCVACVGTGKGPMFHMAGVECRDYCKVCGGTGDLLKRKQNVADEHGAVRDEEVVSRPVQWQRGFMTVSCVSTDVWAAERCPEAGKRKPQIGCKVCDSTGLVCKPTPWARAVSTRVAGFLLTDVVVSAAKSLFRGTGTNDREYGGIHPRLWERVRALKRHNQIDGVWMYFDTVEIATSALGAAAWLLVREFPDG